MKNLLFWVLALAGLASAQISALSLPHTLDSATIPKVSYVDDNDVALKNRLNIVIDSVNGDSILTLLRSNSSLRLTLDADNNATGTCFAITHNGASDTIAKFCDDLSGKVFGALTVSGTLTGAASGFTNGTYSGTLGVTGAVSLASSLTFAAGQDILIADNSGASLTLTQSGNPYLRFVTTDAAEKVSVFKALEAQSTLAVTGLQSNSEAIAFVANGTGGAGRIYRTASDGLLIRGITGSSLDLVLENASGNDIFRNSTGTTSVDFPGSGVTVAGTLAVTSLQSNSEALAFTGNGTAGAGRIFKDATNGIVLRAATGSARDMQIQSQGGTVVMQIPTGTSDVAFPNQVNFTSGSGANFTAAPIMTALAGTGTRVTTSTSTGVQGNATTISGANTWSDVQTFVAPVLGAATATSLVASGNVTTDSLISSKFYQEYSFTLTATGMTTSPTGTAVATRIGKVVTLRVPLISGTSNAATFTLTGLPAGITPTTNHRVAWPGYTDNGVPGFIGNALIVTTGEIQLGTGSGGFAGWTTSGTKASSYSAFGLSVTYTLQ